MYLMYLIALRSQRLLILRLSAYYSHTREELEGIRGIILDPLTTQRRWEFSFPLSRIFDRGVLVDKAILTDNTVIWPEIDFFPWSHVQRESICAACALQ